MAYRLTRRRRALRQLARWHYLATGLGGALALGFAVFVHFALR